MSLVAAWDVLVVIRRLLLSNWDGGGRFLLLCGQERRSELVLSV